MTVVPLSGLLRDDGAVIVPAAVAGEVLKLLARAITAEARDTGAVATPAARALLERLYAAAHADPVGQVAAVPEPAAGGVSTAEAAQLLGCSTQHVRALLAAGRLAGRKSGGVWVVDRPLATSQALDAAA